MGSSIRHLYSISEKLIDHLDDWLCKTAACFLFAMMLVVVSDVAMRYLFNSPFSWSYEIISAYLMPGLFFLSVSHALKSNSHISVDIFLNYVSVRSRFVLAAIGHLLAVPPLAFAAFFMTQQTYTEFINQEYFYSGLGLPVWTTTILAPVGFGLLAVRALLKGIGFAGSLWTSEPLTALPQISGSQEELFE